MVKEKGVKNLKVLRKLIHSFRINVILFSNVLIEAFQNLILLNWFSNKIVHTILLALFSLFETFKGSASKYGGSLILLVFLCIVIIDFLCSFKAIHTGHVQVHENYLKIAAAFIIVFSSFLYNINSLFTRNGLFAWAVKVLQQHLQRH
jgi:hypothetical protein